MKLNKYLDNVECVVINLKIRPDKKIYIEKQLKSRNINSTFFVAEKHNDPKRGCLESHLSVIKEAIKNKVKYQNVFIFLKLILNINFNNFILKPIKYFKFRYF